VKKKKSSLRKKSSLPAKKSSSPTKGTLLALITSITVGMLELLLTLSVGRLFLPEDVDANARALESPTKGLPANGLPAECQGSPVRCQNTELLPQKPLSQQTTSKGQSALKSLGSKTTVKPARRAAVKPKAAVKARAAMPTAKGTRDSEQVVYTRSGRRAVKRVIFEARIN